MMEKNMAGISGCQDCKKRFAGCHAQCDTYKEWRKEWMEKKKQIDGCYRNRNIGYYHK